MRKRLAAAMLAFLFLFSAASADSIAVNFQDTAALLDESGAEFVAPGIYDFIFALSNDAELFCGGSDVGGEYYYALLDAQGNRLSEQVYDMLLLDGDAIIYTRNGLYGAMRPDGEVLFEAAYTQLASNGEGGFLGLITDCFDEEPDGLYLIDEQGNRTATGVKTLGTLGWFSEGLMPLISAENNLYGYVDASGQWAVRPQFAYAAAFMGERALASLSTGYGLIDKTGNWALTPKYASLSYDEASFALAVLKGEAILAIDPETCREIFRVEGDSAYAVAYGGIVQVFDEEKTQLYDYAGNLLHEGSASAAYSPGENGQAILTDGSWGSEASRLINADGSVSQGAWQSLFALFTVDGKGYYGFLSFDSESSFSEALGEEVYDWDSESVLYGVIDGEGREVLPAKYEEMYAVADNRLFVRIGGEEGIIDVAGNWVYKLNMANE